MRTKQEIVTDYLLLLKSENKIGLNKNEIKSYSSSTEGQNKVIDMINNELGCGSNPYPSAYEKHRGQLISSLRAWRLFCKIIVDKDVSTNQEIYNYAMEEFFLLVEKNIKSLINCRRG